MKRRKRAVKKKKGRKRRGYIALFRNGSTNKMQVISLKIKHHPSLSLLIKRKLAKRTNVLNCLTYSKFLEESLIDRNGKRFYVQDGLFQAFNANPKKFLLFESAGVLW